MVYSALPLSHNGTIIDKFHFVVKDGKIVEVHAEQGEEALKAAVTVDEGASYFGEVALVPYDSPISNQKILFYNTLFDENAACHIAFGEAYPCLKDGQAMSKDELKARGPVSYTHLYFPQMSLFREGTVKIDILKSRKGIGDTHHRPSGRRRICAARALCRR